MRKDFSDAEISREAAQEEYELRRDLKVKNRLEKYLAERKGGELTKISYTQKEILDIVGEEGMQQFYGLALEISRSQRNPELAHKDADEVRQMRTIFDLRKGDQVIYMGVNRDGITNEYKDYEQDRREKKDKIEKRGKEGKENKEDKTDKREKPLSLGRRYNLIKDPYISTKTGHITIEFINNKGNQRFGGYQRYGAPI